MKHIKKNLSWFNENVIMLCDKYRTTQCIPLMAIKKSQHFLHWHWLQGEGVVEVVLEEEEKGSNLGRHYP